MNRFITLYSLFIVNIFATFDHAYAKEPIEQLIHHGFALREQAVQIQLQANQMLQTSRKLDKTAIQLRLKAKQNKPKEEAETVKLDSLNQASEQLSKYGADFRKAYNELIRSSDAILYEGFLRLWQKQISHTQPMQIEGSYVDGKTSEFLKQSFSAQNKPVTLDLSIAKPSANGHYYAIIQSLEYPLRINQFHNWKLIISDTSGKPASKLDITIHGTMPSHGHGMPTEPQIAGEQTPGVYLVKGIKFQMRGWWIITFNLNGKQGNDTVSFNLDL